MLASAYQPYLYLSRPVSRRHPMDVGRRAKQFAPFAALRGLDETIRQQEIIYEPKRDLSEEKKNELDMKLRILTYGMKIQATYFQKSWKDPSVGQYHTLSGTVEFFDASVHLRIDDTEIQIQDICDLEQSDNVVIYGHHMKNGSMFSDLCKFESEEFYQEHKTIHFDTLADFGAYEIIAAFKTVAYSQEGFKYYHFVNAEDEAAFDEFIAECKSLSLYDTGVAAAYGDKLITLSTCEYSRTNGRMVIVAKLVVPSAEEVDADAGH